MPSVYTIEGARDRKRGSGGKSCKRVKTGRKRGCTIELCPPASGRGRWRFMKGTRRC